MGACLCCESLCCCCRIVKSDVTDDSEPLIVRQNDSVLSRARFHLMGIRFMYTAFMVIGFVLSLTLWKIKPSFTLWSWLQHIGLCKDGGCSGNYAVYRVSFALMLFYGFHCVIASPLLCCIPPKFRNFVQRKLFFLKWILFIALICVAFYIPNDFYLGWGYVELIAGALFIVCQIIVLIDFAYNWNESWVAKETNFWNVLIVVCSIMLFLVGLGLCIAMYILFHRGGINILFITLTLIFGFFYTIGSIRALHGALLPSAIVFSYTAYLTWSAITSEPNKTYNPLFDEDGSGSNPIQLIFGLGFAAISLFYTAFSTGSSTSAFSLQRKSSSTDYSLDGGDEEEDYREECKAYFIYHLVSFLAAGYMAMIFTGWEIHGTSEDANPNQNWGSVWVKMAGQWLCVLLYSWTLVAPYVLRNREFGWEMDD